MAGGREKVNTIAFYIHCGFIALFTSNRRRQVSAAMVGFFSSEYMFTVRLTGYVAS